LAQTNTNLRTLEKKGDSLYLKRNYLQAIDNYKNVADQTDFSSKKAAIFYNMGCCFSLHGDDDSAFNYLAKAVENGYDNKDWMIVDKDLLKLHNLPRWKP
jgi:TPR repeat protein